MSEQSKMPNEETPKQSRSGKRLERGEKPAMTPEQAKKKRERIIMALMIVLAAVMVIAAALVLLYNRWVKRPPLPPSSSQPPVADSNAPADESAEPTLSFDAVEPKVGGERRSDAIFTILIFGSDETSGLTDTMMVATYDVANQKATVMSLPRDTLINSSARPNINAKKLNAVYNVYGQGDEGIQALKNEVSELVGFVPDYYVQIDWELVGEMVDAIGGVWFDNPRHMEYYDPFQDLNIYQEKGYRFLNGNDAMQIVRFRHSNDGNAISDLERLEIQHSFLKAVLEQTLQIKNITRIGQLIELFNSRVNSDLAVENMLWFGQEAVLGGLKVDDVEFCTMPNALGSYYQFGRDWSFVYPVQSQLLSMINESLNPFEEEVTIKQLDLMSVAADGSLHSSTGRLAAPELGEVPVRETEPPEESDPVESQPAESGEPSESAPAVTDPAASEPVPTETGGLPAESQPVAPTPAPSEDVNGGQPSQVPADNEEEIIDWGDTPD